MFIGDCDYFGRCPVELREAPCTLIKNLEPCIPVSATQQLIHLNSVLISLNLGVCICDIQILKNLLYKFIVMMKWHKVYEVFSECLLNGSY